jgi:hypothetical protein
VGIVGGGGFGVLAPLSYNPPPSPLPTAPVTSPLPSSPLSIHQPHVSSIVFTLTQIQQLVSPLDQSLIDDSLDQPVGICWWIVTIAGVVVVLQG